LVSSFFLSPQLSVKISLKSFLLPPFSTGFDFLEAGGGEVFFGCCGGAGGLFLTVSRSFGGLFGLSAGFSVDGFSVGGFSEAIGVGGLLGNGVELDEGGLFG
jgi:hypothetical protein